MLIKQNYINRICSFLHFQLSTVHALGKFFPNLAKLQKQLATASELRLTMPDSEREEMHHSPRPGWLRLLLLRGMKLAAGPASFPSDDSVSSLYGPQSSFIKFNVKEEAEHTVPLPALRGWADSLKHYPDQKQRCRDRWRTIQVVTIGYTTEIRFNKCFYEHM